MNASTTTSTPPLMKRVTTSGNDESKNISYEPTTPQATTRTSEQSGRDGTYERGTSPSSLRGDSPPAVPGSGSDEGGGISGGGGDGSGGSKNAQGSGGDELSHGVFHEDVAAAPAPEASRRLCGSNRAGHEGFNDSAPADGGGLRGGGEIGAVDGIGKAYGKSEVGVGRAGNMPHNAGIGNDLKRHSNTMPFITERNNAPCLRDHLGVQEAATAGNSQVKRDNNSTVGCANRYE